ncbi:MAG: hypothetical protein MJZ94_04265, partial [Bacteroidales bacterium]|nr:hypothetical protein [Bacteroidales bacterium]
VRLSFCPFGAVSLPPVRHPCRPALSSALAAATFPPRWIAQKDAAILQDGYRYPSSRKSFVFGFPLRRPVRLSPVCQRCVPPLRQSVALPMGQSPKTEHPAQVFNQAQIYRCQKKEKVYFCNG